MLPFFISPGQNSGGSSSFPLLFFVLFSGFPERPTGVRTLVLMMLLCLQAEAQQRSLTLEDCLRIARANSLSLRLEQTSARTAELAKSELEKTGLPQLKAVGNARYAPEFGRSGYDPIISDGGQLAGQAVVEQSVFDGGVRSLKSDQLQLEIDRLGLERRAVDRDMVYAVTAAFVDARRAGEEAAIQTESVRQLQDYLELVRGMMRGGTASQTDVLKTRVQLDNARVELARALQDGILARAALAAAMGTPIDTSFALSGEWESPDSSSIPGARAPSIGARSLDLQMAGLDMQKSLLDVQLSERERLPAVNFTGDAGLLSSVDNLRLPAGERVTGLGYSVGLQVELPLFTWGSIGLRIEQRRLAAEAQQLRLQQLTRGRQAELLGVTTRLATVKTTVQVMRGTLRSAEDAFLLTKSRFAGGASLSLEVLSAQQLMADTRVAFFRALAEWHTLKARLTLLTAQ